MDSRVLEGLVGYPTLMQICCSFQPKCRPSLQREASYTSASNEAVLQETCFQRSISALDAISQFTVIL